MFAITKLSPKSQDFLSIMTQNNKSRSLLASIAVAKALTFDTSLPSAPVDDVLQYFRTQNLIQIESFVNDVNELMVLDVKTVLDLAFKFYQQRYMSAYPSARVFSFNKGTGVVDFFGISRSIDEATLKAIEEDPGTLAVYTNNFASMMEELKVSQ